MSHAVGNVGSGAGCKKTPSTKRCTQTAELRSSQLVCVGFKCFKNKYAAERRLDGRANPHAETRHQETLLDAAGSHVRFCFIKSPEERKDNMQENRGIA